MMLAEAGGDQFVGVDCPTARPNSRPKYDVPRSDVLPFVPRTANRLLDVGCGTGRLGAELRATSPELDLWAIEPNAEMAIRAREVFGHVLEAPFDVAFPVLPSHAFDVVTFTDVLEHIVDPWEVLKLARSLLSASGLIVASIPNVRHVGVLAPLLFRGEFRYEEYGLLDRTHLRFFTRRSVLRLFVESGYEIESINGINPTIQRMAGKSGRVLKRLRKFTHLFDDFLYLQFVVVARPRSDVDGGE